MARSDGDGQERVRFLDEPARNCACPNCLAFASRLFYEVDGIPIHSCLLMPTHAAALAIPRRRLKLAVCHACGFIYNVTFDATMHDYGIDYEETQAFSSTFNAFAKRLAAEMVERFRVREQTVLEIGCGKAEFLVELCQQGNNRGIAIDPGCRPERIPDDVRGQMEVVQDFFDARHTELDADVICCRHSLEHVGPTYAFMREVSKLAEFNGDTLVMFELPETMRILRECAFWDMYYEHCSYFTPGSLARLFNAVGFSVDELALDYGDQYILLYARRGEGVAAGAKSLANDLQATLDGVAAFRTRGPEVMAQWRQTIGDAHAKGERVALWGSGSKAVSFLTTLGLGDEVDYVIDINPHKWGHFMPATGHKIIGPDDLPAAPPDLVIAMNPIYRQEIQADLDKRKIAARLEAV